MERELLSGYMKYEEMTTVCQMCYNHRSMVGDRGRKNSRLAQEWGQSGRSPGKVGFELT